MATAAANPRAGKGPTRSDRAAQRAKTMSSVGPMPEATAPAIPPGTLKGRGSEGSRRRRTTRAMNSRMRAAP